MHVKHSLWLLSTFIVATFGLWGAGRPNLVVILTDDMSHDQLSLGKHPFMETPHLDQMVAEGMRFTRAYATSPYCAPSRASVFSGRMTSAHGRVNNFITPSSIEPYLVRPFHDAGYNTALIGKYQSGEEFANKKLRGGKVFDRWFRQACPDWTKFPPAGPEMNTAKVSNMKLPGAKQFFKEHMYYDQVYRVDRRTEVIKGHQTDVLFDEAGRFATAASEKGQPFMIMLTPFAPHDPENPTLRRKGKYANQPGRQSPNIELDRGRMSREGPAFSKSMRKKYNAKCEMVEDLDEALGRLLMTLKGIGALDNTLILFTSDNGFLFGEHGNAGKCMPWEEALRVPLLARYPKLIEGGKVSDALVSLADLLVTCAEVADIELPKDELRYGKSLVPVFQNPDDSLRKTVLGMMYLHSAREMGTPEWVSLIREDGMKLNTYSMVPLDRPDLPRTQLYNLAKDPFEMNNLAARPEMGELIRSMRNQTMVELKHNDCPPEWVEQVDWGN